MKLSKAVLLFLACLIPGVLSAQTAKKELDHSVYDDWKHISATQLSSDGSILSYEIQPQEGDGVLVVRRLRSAETGSRARKKFQESQIEIPRGYGARLSPDASWLWLRIKAPYSETRQARIAKKKRDDMPKDSLAVVNLKTFEIKKFPNATSLETGLDAMPAAAYKTSFKEGKKNVSALVVLSAPAFEPDTLKYVDEAVFDRAGTRLAYTTKKDPKDSLSASGVFLYDPFTSAKQTLSEGKAFYSKPVFDNSGARLLYLSSSDTLKTGDKHCALEYFDGGQARELIPQGYGKNLPEGWTLNQNSNPVFSPDCGRIFLGVAPILPPKDTSIVDFETARVDIWRWDSYTTPPQEKVQQNRIKTKTYRAVINMDNPSEVIPVTTSYYDRILLADQGMAPYAISIDDSPYRLASAWDDNSYVDISKVSLADGSRETLVSKLDAAGLQISPEGKYLLWFDRSDLNWYSYDIAAGERHNLTGGCGVPFYDEEDDHPTAPPTHERRPRWVEGDKAVLIVDRYDVWRFAPDGSSAVNLSKGYGRSSKLRFTQLDPVPNNFSAAEFQLGRTRSLKEGESIYLNVIHEDDKRLGVARMKISAPNVPVAYVDTFSFTGAVRARDAEVVAFQKGNYTTAYNMHVTEDSFRTDRCISDINPQQKDYWWGNVQMVEWKAYDGTPLKGLLYMPEQPAPKGKYPVMIYFYERNSHTLYNYIQPAPSRSIINIPFYCSRGYMVFVPDIVYQVGHPGESAWNCICSGAEYICDNFPMADRENMAIQGQSWGGYQTAYLITRTDMFKAAGAGAPVGNMTSAYGGIRWESGNVRAVQYEHGQSRIGKSMWEEGGLDLYVENSPVFFVDKVKTPVLIMHNDADGAVPWYQGIEFFSNLRRFGKKAWLLEYNDEAHNLMERRNTRDLSVRLQQFFDHYLKGDPMPAWMKDGIPIQRKGEYFGFEYAE